jgi:hypothetical protein
VKNTQSTAVVVHPLNNQQCFWYTCEKINSKAQIISNNQIDLVGPADNNDKPWHQCEQQASHLPCVTTIIRTQGNYNEQKCGLAPLNVIGDQFQQSLTTLASAETSCICIKYGCD